jgi:hypothetical protein
MSGFRLGSTILAIFMMMALSTPIWAIVYNVPPDPAPNVLVAGDELNLGVGGAVPAFPAPFSAAAGSLINVNGGTVDTPYPVAATVNVNSGLFRPGMAKGAVNIYGGTAGGITIFENVVNVYGGSVGSSAGLGPDATLNLFNGLVGGGMNLQPGSEVNIFGGVMAAPFPPFEATINMYSGTFTGAAWFANSVFNISGGTLVDPNWEMHGSAIAIVTGTSFRLNGIPIPGLSVGSPINITSRNVVLTGTLLDGSSITANISNPGGPGGGVDASATITIILVPESESIVLLIVGGIAVAGIGRMRQ